MNKKEIMYYGTWAFVLLLLSSPCTTSYAQDWYKSKVIIVEGWAELEELSVVSTIPDIEEGNIQKAKILHAAKQVRAITSEILTGMIYGYSFTYTPGDKARAVQEKFTLEPIGTIFDGDKNLSVVNTNIHNASLFVLSRYNLNNAQVRRAESWNISTAYPTAGTGIAMIEDSVVNTKIDALHDAIRDALRRRLRTQLANRPKYVEGMVRISKNPMFVRQGQSYLSKVTVDMMVHDVQKYDTF